MTLRAEAQATLAPLDPWDVVTDFREPEEPLPAPGDLYPGGETSACLVYSDTYGQPVTVPLAGTLTIGRAREADLQVRTDGQVSRLHARLSRDGGQWMVQDLGSTNGTRVDGVLVDRARLVGGESLTLGGTVFQFCRAD